MPINTLDDLFLQQLRDLYSAEMQITKALPKLISAATDTKLQDALSFHLNETETHVSRLNDIAKEFDFKITGHECVGVKGVLAEGDETLKEITDPAVKDAAIIAGAQRVEHYEMAGYTTASNFADDLGYSQVRDTLKETLNEEMAADKKLCDLAKGSLFNQGINSTAVARDYQDSE